MTFKKGDLVMVVKPSLCCNSTKAIGKIYEVGDPSLMKAFSTCIFCGERNISKTRVQLSCGKTIEKPRLIKIDPPADQDQETTNKELEVFV